MGVDGYLKRDKKLADRDKGEEQLRLREVRRRSSDEYDQNTLHELFTKLIKVLKMLLKSKSNIFMVVR